MKRRNRLSDSLLPALKGGERAREREDELLHKRRRTEVLPEDERDETRETRLRLERNGGREERRNVKKTRRMKGREDREERSCCMVERVQ
jgi:hypothetical protein